ncbi:MAG: lipoprotein [Gammaproteobacteria bacterium]|nr:lipoprotein [Gammaproteobacteria bacterium]
MKKIILTLASVVLVAGCSSMSETELSALRADIAASKEASQKAYQAAQQANLNAQDAKAIALRTDEKLNRVFKKAQMK